MARPEPHVECWPQVAIPGRSPSSNPEIVRVHVLASNVPVETRFFRINAIPNVSHHIPEGYPSPSSPVG